MSSKEQPSFTPGRRWSIGFNVVVILLLVFSVVIMVNYLSRDYFMRFHLTSQTRNSLSPRTLKFLETLTNQVKVTIYFDKEKPLYTTINDLLGEYSLANSRIKVKTVDYLRDAPAAQVLKAQYKLDAGAEKNLVIFDAEGKVKVVDGELLARYTLEQVPNEKEREFRRKPTEFLGEIWFTSALLDVTSPKRLKAYFLTGHGEHRIDSGDEGSGYLKFASILEQNYIQVDTLSLLGTNSVPMDCNLLIIAGPSVPFPEQELAKLEEYLKQGGRLFVLFNALSAKRATGLEEILARWGVEVGNGVIVDPDHTMSGSEVIISGFSKHPSVNPLLGTGIYLMRPRPVSRLETNRAQPADAPRVEEIAGTGPRAFLDIDPSRNRHEFRVMVAVEKGAVKGIVTERGTTRILVLGDSFCLANNQIEFLANRDFAGYAANWLLDRTQLLEGLGPRPITEYRLVLTNQQLRVIQWLLLAGLPGIVLAIGALVWARRRY